MFGGGFPHLGRITKGILLLFAACTIAGWAYRPLLLKVLFSADAVVGGQVWRVVTYPWFAGDPLALLFDVITIILFGAQLEMSWGSRVFLKRVLAFIFVPTAVVLLLSVPLVSLRDVPFLGLDSLAIGLVAAWASQMRKQQVTLFPIPISLSGDGLLYFEAGMLALYAIYSQSFYPYLLSIIALAYAVAWFRMGWFKGIRRNWLKLRQKQIESRVAKLRAERHLRVISSDQDDEEEPRRFLH